MTSSPLNMSEAESEPVVTVLIVEDEWTITEELKHRLEAMGFPVAGMCASSEEAIAMCEQHRPGLVLMDICLRTEMDGIEAGRIIRKRFDIPVVYLTAYAHNDLVARAMESAPYGYILKPFNPREVKLSIQTAVHGHRLNQDLRKRNQWLEAVLASLPDAVIGADTNNRVIYLNPAAEVLTGFSRSAALHMPVETLLRFTAEPAPDRAGPTSSSARTLITRTEGQVRVEFARYQLADDHPATEGKLFILRSTVEF